MALFCSIFIVPSNRRAPLSSMLPRPLLWNGAVEGAPDLRPSARRDCGRRRCGQCRPPTAALRPVQLRQMPLTAGCGFRDTERVTNSHGQTARRRGSGRDWVGHHRHRVVNYAAMSEMQICLDPPVSNAALVGVMAQDLYDHATASLRALRLAWVGRGIDTKIRCPARPVLRIGDRR